MTLLEANLQELKDVIEEASREGTAWTVIEAFNLLHCSPYSLAKSLYILWDVAGALLEIRTDVRAGKLLDLIGRGVKEGSKAGRRAQDGRKEKVSGK